MPQRDFYVVIEKGKDGCLVGEAPQLRDCRNRGKTVDELMKNMRKSIEACLIDDDLDNHAQFVGVYKAEVQAQGKNREFFVVVERDEDGFFVGEVTQLTACFSQGRTMAELMDNMREVISLSLLDEDCDLNSLPEFLGVQRVLA